MNIMINDYCNLNCHYCFAGVNSRQVKNDISDENMEKYIAFLKQSSFQKLRILGGEPTLHPNFSKYVIDANNDPFFTDIIIMTNGLVLNQELSEAIVSNKTSFLINLNSIRDIGEESYYQTINNTKYLIDAFTKRKLIPRVFLGINIYSKDCDYKYIIEVAKELNIKGVRYCLTIPCSAGQSVSLDYYSNLVDVLMNFLEECAENNLKVLTDCNYMPKCLFSKEQLLSLMFNGVDLCTKNACKGVYDTNHNLQVTRCMPFFDSLKVNLDDYKTKNEIKAYFEEKIDSIRYQVPTFKECNDCQWFKNQKCQGACLTYKYK